MNHLKLFFEHNNGSLWEIITALKWCNRNEDYGQVDIKPTEEKQIRGFINRLAKGSIFSFNILPYNKKGIRIDFISDDGYGNNKISLVIYKVQDDWFYVKEDHYKMSGSIWIEALIYNQNDDNFKYSEYYRCDSMDGLLNLIENRWSKIN